MLRNLMTVDGETPAEPEESFLDTINQSTISHVKEEIETKLDLDDCMCDIPLKLALALQTGDFITRSDEPGKFSLF